MTVAAAPWLWSQNPIWAGRVVTLQGFGDYQVANSDGSPKLVKPDGLGVNIVVPIAKVDGDRLWISANGAGGELVGWVDKSDAILLDNAIPYFTARIERNPADWDAYLRRAESEHALNQRGAAVADYTRAIEIHPDEFFLFLRRGREFRIMAACPQAGADFEEAARLRPQWAEAYNQAAGVYVDCTDPAQRDLKKGIALIKHAITLSTNPTYLTVLALAYFRSGDLERAVATQKQAMDSPKFPPGYREEALGQLKTYESALSTQKR
jgi:tetratricopeptide (TPR) repeat protein